MDYTLNLPNLDVIAKGAGGSRVGRADPWHFQTYPVLVCEVRDSECVYFEADGSKPARRQLHVTVEDAFGYDFGILAPGYLRVALLRAVDTVEFEALGDGFSEKPWELFKLAEAPTAEVHRVLREAFIGVRLMVAYSGEGEAKAGETAPHLFKVWTLPNTADLSAIQATIDKAYEATGAYAEQAPSVPPSTIDREGL